MNIAADTASVAVLRFGARQLPGPLNGLPVHDVADVAGIDAAIGPYRRLVVIGTDADLATTATYTGLLYSQVGTAFNGCAAGTKCMPHIVCDASCATETYGSAPADKMALVEDMVSNCVARH